MPLYTFHCSNCGATIERITFDYKSDEIRCTGCGKKARKIPTASANMNRTWAKQCSYQNKMCKDYRNK